MSKLPALSEVAHRHESLPSSMQGLERSEELNVRVNEPLIRQTQPQLCISPLGLAENPKVIDLFLVPHDLPVNLAPLSVCLHDTISSSQVVRFIKQAQLVKLLPVQWRV